jgi:leucyl aminopeptidase
MKITLDSRQPSDLKVDVLVLAAGKDWKAGEVERLDQQLGGRLVTELTQQGFKGTLGAVALFQTHGALPARCVLVVGLGDGDARHGALAGRAAPPGGSSQPSTRPWHTLAHATVTRARDLNAASAAIVLPAAQRTPEALETLSEGVLLGTYVFDRMKSAPQRRTPLLHQVVVAVNRADAAGRAAVARGERTAAATCYARDLINTPAGIVTPTYLADEARRIARQQRLRARILDAAGIKRAGMGALLGVAQGSAQPPRFIELVYKPAGAPRRCVALAGKGITFDSGGLSLKNAEAMASQKRDMAGGAAVLAVMSVVRDLEIPVEVRAYVPSTENMPGGRAIKPGDVVRAYNGTTIEVLNTDAEGRLVLADALAVGAAAAPDVMIDLATLTAAVRTALGTRYAAIMGTDATLIQALISAGNECGENLWELPLVADYRADIESSVADIKNTGEGSAGTIIGGLFLREFVGTVPWAHIDFSSTVMADKPMAGHPRGATGFGVRTLLRYLRNQ